MSTHVHLHVSKHTDTCLHVSIIHGTVTNSMVQYCKVYTCIVIYLGQDVEATADSPQDIQWPTDTHKDRFLERMVHSPQPKTG